MVIPLPLPVLTKELKMIQLKSTLSKKDKEQVSSILKELSDYYSDFYITRNNIRLYIKENIEILYKLLSKGDKIIFEEDGLAIISGWSDKSPRKYMKLLAKDDKITDKLIKNINWNISEELYCKIKKTNPLKNILLKNRWKFAGDRGKEILLKRESIEIKQRENKYEHAQ